ncbi:MAG: AGE family epimerase/isomerase, partial [Lachnospira sp.]
MDTKEFYNHLCNDLIPFWNNMKDNINGGFYGYADHNGTADKNSIKGSILSSRILWFYSAAYQLLNKEELLEMANHSYIFLANKLYDSEYGGIFWSVNAKGDFYDDTKHTYSQAFAIYGLSAYYQASRNSQALDLAYTLYHTIESKCRDKYGYLEAFSRDFFPISNEKLSENGVIAERTMNTLLHILEAYTELYKADKSTEVGNTIKEILHIFKTKIYSPEKKICNVFFDINYNSLINLESFGHDIEASWLIDKACHVLNDKDCYHEMNSIINGLTESAYSNGIDINNHSMNNEYENGQIDRKKIWWVQAEAVTGFYNAYQNDTKHTEYLHISEQIWEYIQLNFIDRKSGEWIENIQADNTVEPNQALV